MYRSAVHVFILSVDTPGAVDVPRAFSSGKIDSLPATVAYNHADTAVNDSTKENLCNSLRQSTSTL